MFSILLSIEMVCFLAFNYEKNKKIPQKSISRATREMGRSPDEPVGKYERLQLRLLPPLARSAPARPAGPAGGINPTAGKTNALPLSNQILCFLRS